MANWLLRDIWQGHPLADQLGDVSQVPRTVEDLVNSGPLIFRGRFQALLLWVAPLLWFLVMMLLSIKAASLAFELRVALSAMLPVILIATSVSQMGWTIVLSDRGVDFTSFGSVVHCPWRVFNVGGWPIFDSQYRILILPVNPEHSFAIEKRRHELPTGTGSNVRTFQVRFPNSSRLRLRGYYGVDLVELGDLILGLGRSAAGATGVMLPDRGRDAASPHHLVGGWRTLDLARDVIPACCCGCGSDVAVMRRFRHAPWYSVIAEARIESELSLPVCRHCWNRHRIQPWMIVLSCITLAIWCFAFAMSRSSMSVVGLIGGMLVIGIMPLLARTRIAGAPARLRRFAQTAGTFEVWTRFPDFFAAVPEMRNSAS